MIRGIDHLVIACPDPDAAAAELESAIGLSVTGGGRHEGTGTFNRIAWLGDTSYLELIGIDDPDALAASALRAPLEEAMAAGGGLAAYALLDDDIELTVNALSGAGSSFGRPIYGSRRRPDGELVEWWTAHLDEPFSRAHTPFLIQHAYYGVEWGASAMAERARFAHPIGSSVILARLDLATDDPPRLASLYHAQLGLEFWAVADMAVCAVGRHTIRLMPRRLMDLPAAVTFGAHVDRPRSATALGLRLDIQPVELPLPATAELP